MVPYSMELHDALYSVCMSLVPFSCIVINVSVVSYTNRMVSMPCTLLLRMVTWKQWSTSFLNLAKRSLTRAMKVRHVWMWPFNNRSKMWWTGFFRRVGLPPISSRWAPSNLQSWSVPLPHPTNVCTPHWMCMSPSTARWAPTQKTGGGWSCRLYW